MFGTRKTINVFTRPRHLSYPTCFGDSCDHLQGCPQYKYQEYKKSLIKCIIKFSEILSIIKVSWNVSWFFKIHFNIIIVFLRHGLVSSNVGLQAVFQNWNTNHFITWHISMTHVPQSANKAKLRRKPGNTCLAVNSPLSRCLRQAVWPGITSCNCKGRGRVCQGNGASLKTSGVILCVEKRI